MKKLKWKPKYDLNKLIDEMIRFEIKQLGIDEQKL